ncbi:3-hydroxyacyl-CoA dehydrogenase NAD-binding domain-containing protein [Bradyrhizobium sp. CCGB12]|uniref:3-hydroxyacyl-CoA dehydrogenase family protein n=1 Tax=Bradyrhizobium sp. CCGB12 TaxID=2949632 RepID=UPI0020B2FB03|nr:3-hydroxyacyl-CoA dehydrogenase NAD-binding domain-containing protein [Bradyrhizobium sp. CCGB12]MCP3392260.1 3-hydroxyacyl-CoA dehydrogenase NAD-binding domain-containing protein [Bradyrhizobium sp. CCGB12]
MIERIAVVGAGLMGHGIVQLFARHGYPVALCDMSADALVKARHEIEGIFHLLGQDSTDAGAVSFSTDLRESVTGADVIIEAAPENSALKQEIFRSLDVYSKPEALLASNTSVIPITTIAQPVRDKGRVLGTHFWNPPYLIPLVEVVETAATRRAASDRMMALLARVGQEPVRVLKDIPGFIGNRLQHALKREAIALVANGVCDAETVDRVIKLGFGARLGVLGTLEQSDMVGLNLTLDIHRNVMLDLDITRGPHPYLEKLVSDGHLGMKTGKGFYEWTDEKAEAVRQRLRTFLAHQLQRKVDEERETVAPFAHSAFDEGRGTGT